MPKGDELVQRPDGKVLREKLNKLEKVISNKYNKMRDKNKELKEISISIEQKNKGVFKELKEKNQLKKKEYDKIDSIK